ncbi:zinc-ribbon domain containing protein [Vandammella animalimorsus]|uniref:zinc-ribbon domain containing protein n=1 Tax=Vandammella animalimorsus TaxID=2029117 RepID=UPI001EEDF1BE|nr:zinc-ribbon domain containing protein [Vandammella animalimorsus]
MKSSNKQRRAQQQQQRLARTQDWPTRKRPAPSSPKPRARARVWHWSTRPCWPSTTTPPFCPATTSTNPFTCCRCGAQEVWTAKQQKWWYEVAHGPIYSGAKHCRACRDCAYW